MILFKWCGYCLQTTKCVKISYVELALQIMGYTACLHVISVVGFF